MPAAEKYGAQATPSVPAQEGYSPIFGQTIVSCEYGSIRQSPTGLIIYSAKGRRRVAVPSNIGRRAELLALRRAIDRGEPAYPDGEWGRETLRVCLALRDSARTGKPVSL